MPITDQSDLTGVPGVQSATVPGQVLNYLPFMTSPILLCVTSPCKNLVYRVPQFLDKYVITSPL
jgi:hypothetical protein